MGHVTLSTPILGWFVIHRLGFDTFYLCDDSSLNRSRDITGAPKFKVGHVTLTTHLLRVIYQQNAGT